MGDKNYVTSQQTRKEAKESSVVHSDESAQQTFSSAPRSMLTSLSTVARETGVTGCYANNFKSQKDKRQKLDSVQIIVESENEIIAPQLSSCLIRPKSNRIESLYTRHQQHNFQKPPVINTNKITADIGRSDVIESLERNDNSVHATASAGVRMFHGLDQVPNISDEEGNAADWAGHAMSSTSAPVELSGENSKTVLGDMSSKKLNDITPDSGGVSRVSESPRSRKKSAGQSLAGTPEEKRPLCNINEKLLDATVSPCGDSTVSYRDQVISNEIQNQTTSAPSVQIDPLTSRGQLSSFVKKNSGSSLSEWPPPDNKRPGTLLRHK